MYTFHFTRTFPCFVLVLAKQTYITLQGWNIKKKVHLTQRVVYTETAIKVALCKLISNNELYFTECHQLCGISSEFQMNPEYEILSKKTCQMSI